MFWQDTQRNRVISAWAESLPLSHTHTHTQFAKGALFFHYKSPASITASPERILGNVVLQKQYDEKIIFLANSLTWLSRSNISDTSGYFSCRDVELCAGVGRETPKTLQLSVESSYLDVCRAQNWVFRPTGFDPMSPIISKPLSYLVWPHWSKVTDQGYLTLFCIESRYHTRYISVGVCWRQRFHHHYRKSSAACQQKSAANCQSTLYRSALR